MKENGLKILDDEMSNFCCAMGGGRPRRNELEENPVIFDNGSAFKVMSKVMRGAVESAPDNWGTTLESGNYYVSEENEYSNLVPEVKAACGGRPLGWGKKKKAWRECKSDVEDRMGREGALSEQAKQQVLMGSAESADSEVSTKAIIGVSIGAVLLLGLGTYLLIRARRKSA